MYSLLRLTTLRDLRHSQQQHRVRVSEWIFCVENSTVSKTRHHVAHVNERSSSDVCFVYVLNVSTNLWRANKVNIAKKFMMMMKRFHWPPNKPNEWMEIQFHCALPRKIHLLIMSISSWHYTPLNYTFHTVALVQNHVQIISKTYAKFGTAAVVVIKMHANRCLLECAAARILIFD